MSSVPEQFVTFTCSNMSTLLKVGEHSHTALKARSELVGWLVCYHLNSIVEWGLVTSFDF